MGVVIFKNEIETLIRRFLPKLQFVMKLIGFTERLISPVEVILFILAAVLGLIPASYFQPLSATQF
ncbi:cytochrome c nitrite reductase, NrfD subunit [Rodentibacter pneumotropicus]|uniref:Cytochrome c nitrite reductase, NrfD subunit n=1 Tax=Rodentibacter pneumotropicus TaxID=758 RepID=A0A3S4URP0_9PAST|nr:cytochrome c nitrite reductase, NrfD subunit [Rodentibacter pneumotropicus]